MPKYRVAYKYYYYEHSEWSHTDVVADSKRLALQEFFAEIRSFIENSDLEDAHLPDRGRVRWGEEYQWWEGDWLTVYQGIEETDAEICPLCLAQGEVSAVIAHGFRDGI